MEKPPTQPKNTNRFGPLARRGALSIMMALGLAGAAKGQSQERRPINTPDEEPPAAVIDPSVLNVDQPLPVQDIFEITLQYKKEQWLQDNPGGSMTPEIEGLLTAEVIRELQQQGEQAPREPTQT